LTRALATLPEAVGWTLVLVLALVLVLVAAVGLLWLARYAVAYADARRRDKAHADRWRATHRRNQDRGRYDYDIPGSPE
jgi:hypothetical protein